MKKIFELGISSDFADYKNQAVIASNKISFALLLAGISFFLMSVFFFNSYVYFSLLFVALVSTSMVLSHHKFVNFSRVLILAGTVIFVSFVQAYLVTPGSSLAQGLYLAQFILIVLPWLIIDLREWPLLLSTTLLALAAFIIQPWIIESMNQGVHSGGVDSAFLGYLFSVALLFILIMGLYNLKSAIERDERQKGEVLNQVDEKSRQMAYRKDELQKRIEEVKKTHKTEEQRSWVAQGVSQMIDLMRSKKDNLYPELIEAIVSYLGASVGAIYTVTDEEFEEKQLKLEGCYAYDRRKFLDYSIPFGDGVTGQSCMDREIVYIDKIPDNFLDIASGLGDDPPTRLAIVPLYEEAEVAGVLEIAADKDFEDHQKEFLRQLSASIGSFILANTVNEKIKILIEQNQTQAEEMRAQEEEMLQNLEELHATQEEMSRKEKEYIEKIEKLEKKLSLKPKVG